MTNRATPRVSERIFQILDLGHPGLGRVKQLHGQGHHPAAICALHDYIRGRDWGASPPERDPTLLHARADDLLRNVFHLGPFEVYWGTDVSQIEWYTPPEVLDDLHLFYVGFSRHNDFVPHLAEAYWHTGDERYAEKLVELILDWIERCPAVDAAGVRDNGTFALPADEDGDGKPDRPGYAGMVWKPFCTMRRVLTWCRMFTLCRDARAFAPQVWCRMLCSISEQIDTVLEDLPRMSNRGNHSTRAAETILHLSFFWPQIARVYDWRRITIDKLARCFNWFSDGGFIYPDGATAEITESVTGTVIQVGKIIKTLRCHDLQVPHSILDVHERMCEYALGVMEPDSAGSPGLAEIGTMAAAIHDRQDLLRIATGGKQGRETSATSWPWRPEEPCYAGTYLMRSGWGRDDTALRTRFGPLEYMSPLTGYGSVGEVAVWGHGVNWVPYMRCRPHRGEFKAFGDGGFEGDGRSENTISVDGVGQSRYGRKYHPETPVDNAFVTCPIFDWVRGAYTFDPDELDQVTITHTRAILFVRPDYFLVIDRLEPSDGTAHEYRMKYQLHHTVSVPSVEGVRATGVAGGAGIVVQPLCGDLRLDIVNGQKEPYYEGWHIVEPACAMPADALVYTWEDSGSSGLETLLCPFPARSEVACSVRASSRLSPDGSVVVTVTGHRSDTTDHVLIAGAQESASSDGFELAGALGFVRMTAGEVVAMGMADAATLTAHGLSLTAEASVSPARAAWTERSPGGGWQRGELELPNPLSR